MPIGNRFVLKRPSLLSCLIISIAVILSAWSDVWADEFARLKGLWECTEEGTRATLEFKSKQNLVYNGTTYTFQLAPGVFQVQDDTGVAAYFYTIEDGILLIMSMRQATAGLLQTRAVTRPVIGGRPVQTMKGDTGESLAG